MVDIFIIIIIMVNTDNIWMVIYVICWTYHWYIYIPWKYESNVSIDSACSYFGETWIITIKYVYTMHIISITHIYVYIYILYIERMYKYMCVWHTAYLMGKSPLCSEGEIGSSGSYPSMHGALGYSTVV